MSKTKCAPLVFGRTYEVDFRFLVVPEDFQVLNQVDFKMRNQAWLENHIDATTILSEQLVGQPRWSIFKDRTHCIVGVTCMALDVSNEKTQDCQGRSLYVFLGYVFRSVEIQPFPMDLEAFSDLYEKYVLPSWDEKIYSTRSKSPELAPYQNFEESAHGLSSAKPELVVELNYDGSKISLWPNLPEFREKLWYTASKSLQPVSVCLGLPNEASALRGNFTNGTTLDFRPVKVLDREQKVLQKIVLDRSNRISEDAQWNEADEALHRDERPSQTKKNREGISFQGRDRGGPPRITPQEIPRIEGIEEVTKKGVRSFLELWKPSSQPDQYSPNRSPASDEDETSSADDRTARQSPSIPSIPSIPSSPSSKRDRGKRSYPLQNQPTNLNPEKGIEFGFKPKEDEGNNSDNQDEWF